MTRLGLTFLLIVPALAPADEPVSLERALVRRAPELIKHCHEKGYKTIGVLKFLVNREGEPKFSDNVGTLNMTLARQLELALVVGNDPDEKKTVGIVADASAVAAKTPGADHMTRPGREKLFAARYPLAWLRDGKPVEVPVDALFTGTASLSADLRTLTVTVLVADPKGLHQVGPNTVVRAPAARLGEAGESFLSTRGVFDGGRVKIGASDEEKKQAEQKRQEHEAALAAAAAQVKTKTARHPLEDAAAPVGVEVQYGGKLVPIAFDNGQAFLPEPAEGESVRFILRRKTTNTRTYGTVLKVNGENSLFRQRLPDLHCTKWIMSPGCADMAIEGFYRDGQVVGQFKGLSVVEAKAQGLNYGPEVGMITLSVFAERTGRETPAASDEAKKESVVAAAAPPPEPPANYNALLANLLDGANRAVIGEGAPMAGAIKLVEFTPDPSPVMTAAVRYRKP